MRLGFWGEAGLEGIFRVYFDGGGVVVGVLESGELVVSV